MTPSKAWSEEVSFKTYQLGAQDRHPMFLEHRVYQGSSGAVYPYGVTDTLADEAREQKYQALMLENDFIKVMILPELGGRVHRAYDKVNQRDFVYFNHVVKPALVGLLGPWISGGIEFNWPQHHRPTTFMKVDGQTQTNADGSASVTISEKEPMHGLTITTTFTLPQDKALLEIKSTVYNGNETARSFLWWSNPAVKGGDDHQSIFPPDVTAVYDHGKRAVIDFPIAHGEYYKVKYDGVDISRYQNLPVPTSYMAWRSNYDFVGAYSYNEDGGLLHIADHHVAPGKKQWTWGNGDFGQAWDRSLTDSDGPYIELMTGVYTDNQPDFTWLGAHESKQFTQNFLPYSKLGRVHNANTQAAIKLERKGQNFEAGVYAIGYLTEAKVEIYNGKQLLGQKDITLEPCRAVVWDAGFAPAELCTIKLLDKDGKVIVAYTEHKPEELPLPEVAPTPKLPHEVTSTDEAYFIAQHLDQYHHASRRPEDYYLRALEIDPLDYRCNTALGQREFERCQFAQAKEYALTAQKRALMLNRNCECGKSNMLLADALLKEGKLEAAYDEYFRATWSCNCKTQGYNGLATICARQGKFKECAAFAAEALKTQALDVKAQALRAYGLLQSGSGEAQSYIAELAHNNPLNSVFAYLSYLTQGEGDLAALNKVLNDREINYLSVAEFLVSVGAKHETIALMRKLGAENKGAIIALIMAALTEDKDEQAALCVKAEQVFGNFVRFINSVFERELIGTLTKSAFALHLCASFDYSRRLYDKAKGLWEQALALDPNYADALRGLGIYYCNKKNDLAKALACYEKALAAAFDERLLFECSLVEKLYKVSAPKRLKRLEKANPKTFVRDDLKAEYLTLLNLVGRADEAYEFLSSRIFHVWEGGEGRVTEQFVINAILRAKALVAKGDLKAAHDVLESALVFPHNLSEGRLVGQTDNDLYFLKGVIEERLGDKEQAHASFVKATQGEAEVHEQRYYNDQKSDYVFFHALALEKLGQKDKAQAIYQALETFGKSSLGKPIETDFFAVSLPDLIVLDRNLEQERDENAYLMQFFAALGKGDEAGCKRALETIKTLNPSNFKAAFYEAAAGLIQNFKA